MLKKTLCLLLLISSFGIGWLLRDIFSYKDTQVHIIENIKEKPLEKYAFENLFKTEVPAGKFKIEESLKDEDKFESFLFNFEFNPNLDGKTFKTTTGQINIPKSSGQFSLIFMFRGYINQETYKTGYGTRNASEYFAENGFITVAPDFLGYGSSDNEVENIFEARFQTYITAISLINSINQIDKWDQKNIFIWGHSNGGQIALTALEITAADYPTTLWAPVSKPFPYSVLYYTDESEDRGKLIRSELANFEEDYNVENYSLTNYLDKINAPIQIHQGKADEAVPVSWSDTLVNLLKEKDKEVIYYTYPITDHNMRPNWNSVIEHDLEFFRQNLKS